MTTNTAPSPFTAGANEAVQPSVVYRVQPKGTQRLSNMVCPIEVSRALALAIGWDEDSVQSLHPAKSWHPPANAEVYDGTQWRKFDYAAPDVEAAITKRYGVQVEHREGRWRACVPASRGRGGVAVWAKTQSLAVALAVIAHEGKPILPRSLPVDPAHLHVQF